MTSGWNWRPRSGWNQFGSGSGVIAIGALALLTVRSTACLGRSWSVANARGQSGVVSSNFSSIGFVLLLHFPRLLLGSGGKSVNELITSPTLSPGPGGG